MQKKQADYELTYRITGTGTPVLLINDINQHMDAWYKVEDKLKDDCRLILFNRAGMYPSTIGQDVRTIDRNVSDAAAILVSINLEQPVVVIGRGYGGVIAGRLANDYPELVKQVVMIGDNQLNDSQYNDQWLEFCRQRGYSNEPIDGISLQFDENNTPTDVIAKVEAMYQLPSFYRMMYEELHDWKLNDNTLKTDNLKQITDYDTEILIKEIRNLI